VQRLKAIGLLLAILACSELWVRMFVVSPANVVFDEALGPMKAPFSHILRTYEGHGEYTNDAYGFNNDAWLNQNNTYRWLVLGDSFVEAKQVPREQGFVGRLNAHADIAAYNAGYSGADPRSFPILAARFIPVVKPTDLLLCVNADDLTSLSSDTLPKYTAPTGLKLFLQPLFAHSALATHLNWKYKPVLQAWWSKWHSSPQNASEKAHQAEGTLFKLRWSHILQTMQTYGIPLRLVVFPSIHYSATQAHIVPDWRITTMIQVAQSKGIQVIQMDDEFVQDFKQTRHVAFGFMNSHLGTGHLNAHGHQLVANVILQKLHAENVQK